MCEATVKLPYPLADIEPFFQYRGDDEEIARQQAANQAARDAAKGE